MSEENVEIVRKGLDAYRRRDLAAAFASIDPEISWNPAEEVPRRGVEAVRSNLEHGGALGKRHLRRITEESIEGLTARLRRETDEVAGLRE